MLRGIFETAAIGISACDRDGGMIEFNPAYQEMLGYTAEELKSKTFWTSHARTIIPLRSLILPT
ncbi:MAG: PAS domain S-box protein [Alphaproteobacteria bacterium]